MRVIALSALVRPLASMATGREIQVPHRGGELEFTNQYVAVGSPAVITFLMI